jgi:hypothetical protein
MMESLEYFVDLLELVKALPEDVMMTAKITKATHNPTA